MGYETFPCPRCGRRLEKSGEAECGTIYPRACPVFQCDECLATVDMGGDRFEIALTFAVDEDGRAFDPASDDGSPPSWAGGEAGDGPE